MNKLETQIKAYQTTFSTLILIGEKITATKTKNTYGNIEFRK